MQMIITKVLSYKELKEITKKNDLIIRDVRELMVKSGTSDRSTYVRLSADIGDTVRVWRSKDGNGIWLTLNFGCFNSHSVFITRGHVSFLIKK